MIIDNKYKYYKGKVIRVSAGNNHLIVLDD